MDAPTVLRACVTSLLMTSCLATRVTITSPTEDVSMSPGEPLEITCEVTDVPDSELRNGKLEWGHISSTINVLTSDETNYVIKNTTSNQMLTSTLRIVSVTFEDDGTYFCTWRYGGERSDYLTLTVTGFPDIVHLELDRQPVAGRDVVITCIAQGNPFPTIRWNGPGGALVSQLGVTYDISTKSTSSYTTRSRLTLQGMTLQASGAFRCVTTNSLGSADDFVNVRLDPWTSILEPVEGENNPPLQSPVYTGLSDVSLQCNAYNVPKNVTIEWSFRREGTGQFIDLTDYPSVTISRTSALAVSPDAIFYVMTSELRFQANFSTHGTLRCRAFDGRRMAVFERDLYVEDRPQVILTPGHAAVAIGDDVEVTCIIQARPSVTDSYWARRLTRVNSAERRVNDFTQELRIKFTIRSVEDMDQSVTCYATNMYGTESLDFHIEDEDECESNVCSGETEYCVNTVGSFRCECDPNHYRDSYGDCRPLSGPVLPTLFPLPPDPQQQRRHGDPPPPQPAQRPGQTGHLRTSWRGGGRCAVRGHRRWCRCRYHRHHHRHCHCREEAKTPTGRRNGGGSQRCKRSPPNAKGSGPDSSTTYANPAFAPNLEGYSYTPLNTRDRSEFPRDRLHMQEKLGHGKFGMVARALALSIHTNGKWDTVAVKRLKEAATDAEKSEFFRELTLLRSLPRHQNLVMFVGCCTTEDPTLIIMEYCEKGDLLTYLRMRRPEKRASLGNPTNDLTSRDLFSFALHVARGMSHIAKHKIVHRDVATRNVLITDRYVCKVADLGLARRLGEDNDVYELVSRRPLPIRWMSPESLRDGVHTSQSDVWSYGILLWELITLGASPYPGKSGKAVIDLVIAGRQPEIPPQCTGQLASIMTSCWYMRPTARPTFDVIAGQFERLLEEEGDYLSLDNMDEGIYSILEPSTSGERV